MRARNVHTTARGMSLIEAIVTLALLAVVLLALAPLFTQSVNINASSSQLSTANSLAREKLEELLMYPTTDPRLQVTAGAAVESYPKTGDPADLPTYWNPATGEAKNVTDSPGAGWFPYPFRRTYTVQPFHSAAVLTSEPVAVPGIGSESGFNVPMAPLPNYDVKLVTVTVEPTAGPFPGLRRTRQSAFVRYRNALPN